MGVDYVYFISADGQPLKLRTWSCDFLVETMQDLVEGEGIEGFGEVEAVDEVVVPVVEVAHVLEVTLCEIGRQWLS